MAVVVLRIKGRVNVPHWAKYTLENLTLHKKFWATLLPETPETLGMLNKIKDFVAWTRVDEALVKELLVKRGKTKNSKPLANFLETGPYHDIKDLVSDITEERVRLSNIPEIKPWFALNPPRGGFKRNTKTQFEQKGILGNDKELVDIIRRMI